MKRVLTILLTLTLLTGVLPFTALAAGSGSISLDKAIYAPNEDIVVTASGITQQMVDDSAYISIYKKGAQHSDYMSWRRPVAGESQLTFTAPSELGSYEMRLYNRDHVYTDETFVMSVPFIVGMEKQGKISLEKIAYQAQQPIAVTVTEITADMEQSGAYVSIYKKGAKHSEYGTYTHVKAGSSVVSLTAPNLNGEFEMRLYAIDHNYTDESFVMSVPFNLSGAADEQQTSDWAAGTIAKADALGLIPASLKSADLTRPITRAEFAAVAVKTYENLTGKTTTPVAKNPFTDTTDTEVLKAYNVGITSGTAADKFSPDVLLNREQCATMLTRVLKASYIPGWTLSTDNSFTLNFTQPVRFADDAKISDWAKPSVYFMAANGIISGTGNNNFSPRATTPAEQAVNFASATREQALVIAVRMVENLKDKTLDYTESAAQPTPDTQPPTPSTSNSNLIGSWQCFSVGMTSTSTVTRNIIFSGDGTFSYAMITSNTTFIEGRYSVSNGIISLTDILETESDGTKAPWSDKKIEYSLGEDEKGAYLTIGYIHRDEDYSENQPGMKFRRA